MPEVFRLVVNGEERTVTAPPDRPLQRVIREDLRLTGTKDGCSDGQCGACTVVVDGKAELSCLKTIAQVAGKSVWTVEGLGTPEHPHPIQQAFAQSGAVQCGFCTPGVVMTTKALLDQHPNPTDAQLRQALNRNLCRCTGYIKIVEAARTAAAMLQGQSPPAAPPAAADNGGVIGARLPRPDALIKACGKAVYAADIEMADMLQIKVLRSPHRHARIVALDTAAALKLPGVVAVLTAADMPGVNRVKVFRLDQPILAEDRVRFVGDPVAAVVAESEAAALQALGAIDVTYELLPVVNTPEEGLAEGAPLLHPEGNLVCSNRIAQGDIARGEAEAAVIVERQFTTPWVEHAYLEAEAGVAHIDDAGRVVVRASTQNPHDNQEQIAAMLAVPTERVRFIQTVTGGAFGGKQDISYQGILALAAYKLQRPVRLVYTREESMLATTKRHPFQIRARLGAHSDGSFAFLQMDFTMDSGAYCSFAPGVLTRALVHATGPYHIPHVAIAGRAVYTNNPVAGAMRGFGVPQVTLATETLIDLVAEQLELDPLQIRVQNGFRDGSTTITQQTLPVVALSKTLEAIEPHYAAARRWRDETAPAGWVRGIGLAAMWFGLGKTGRSNRSDAVVELDAEGRLIVYSGAADVGQGADTAMRQFAAATLGQPFAAVQVVSADTLLTLNADCTSASRQTYITGNAVRKASEELKAYILRHAAEHLDTPVQELEVVAGGVQARTTGRLISLAELAAATGPVRIEGFYDVSVTHLDPQTGAGIPFETFSFGVQLAQVEVESRTGKVRVAKMVVAHDVGVAINPLAVEGQLEGGAVMGMGWTLTEEYKPGITSGLKDYRVPRLAMTPEIVAIPVECPQPTGPFGANGAGESALVPTAPAILNAVRNATGALVTDLPATPARVRALLA